MQICSNRLRVDGRVGTCKCVTLLMHCVTHIYKVMHEKTQYLSGFQGGVHQMCHFFPEEIAYRKKIENIMFHTTLYIFTFSGKKSDTLTQQTESLHAADTKKEGIYPVEHGEKVRLEKESRGKRHAGRETAALAALIGCAAGEEAIPDGSAESHSPWLSLSETASMTAFIAPGKSVYSIYDN